MREERLKVLEMLAAGKINVEEAHELLEALQGEPSEGADSSAGGSWNPFSHFDFASFFDDSFGKHFGSAFGKGGSKSGAAR